MIIIKNVIKNSPADKAGIKSGSRLVSINGEDISDVLDFMFYADPEMGLEFETFLMDDKRGCKNNCVFCFINQLPKGLRETLYFKDDDSRLSFLQGNYITLTNLSEKDVARIIKMKTPVNVSVHTVNPELRSKLMGNPNAGRALDTLYKLAENGISMNCQLVLCKGVNDGEELKNSLEKLKKFNSIESIACVPAGLTKFRDELGLPKIELFDKTSAKEVIALTEKYPNAYAADEFYLTAGLSFPDYDYYNGFPQYENGVGMSAYLKGEFKSAEENYKKSASSQNPTSRKASKNVSIATGTAAYPLIKELVADYKNISVFAIKNNFFGESITVAGLLTARDIIEQLRGENLGEALLLSANMFNSDGLTLDGKTAEDISSALGGEVRVAGEEELFESL